MIDPAEQRRNIAPMVEKLDQFEVQKEVSLLIDSLDTTQRAEVMAALAARYKMRVMPITTGTGPRPSFGKRKTYR